MTQQSSTPAVSIIIPNWNGEAFLGRCLAAAVQSAQASGYTWELVVVDDCSSDNALKMLAPQFPQVRWILNRENLGFAGTVNHGAKVALGETLVLLNNDLVAREPLIRELVHPLSQDPKVFGVSGRTIDWGAREPNHLNMMARFADGTFTLTYEDSDECCDTMFVQGGCCALRSEAYRELGELWEGFSPGYWEDYDLSYLALKTGRRNLYNPKAEAYHFGQGSMNRAHGAERILAIRERNALQFLWLNLTDNAMLKAHLNTLPRRAAKAMAYYGTIQGRSFIKGLWQAYSRRHSIAAEKQRRGPLLTVSDSEIFGRFAERGKPC